MRTLSLILAASLLLVISGCNGSSSNTSGPAAVKENVQPVADPEVAVIEMENAAAYGTITIELYSNIAPKAVERFKELAKEGVYNGVTFHRVNQSVIQSGDPLSKDADPSNDGSGKSDKPNVEAEFSDIDYDTGIVGAARGQDFDSANSQFFITLKREPGFDRRYTVFGKVIDGMVNARTIGGAPRDGERPIDDIRIKTVWIEPRQQN
ncbi:MAG TPA: peptidylprolyl isomerase [Aridibacter sp.]|nr:peptidylprolyl isomerase [Aridibacter sp.]